MDLFEEIVRMRRAGQRGALATIVHTNGSIPSFESSRMLVREDGSTQGTIGGGCVEADVWAAAKEVMQKEVPRKLVFHLNNEATYDNGLICGGTVEVFVEPILPQPVVVLFGGGHVSTAVAKAAHAAGFGVTVVDDREAFANAQRFPMAQDIYTSYEEAFDELKANVHGWRTVIVHDLPFRHHRFVGERDGAPTARWLRARRANRGPSRSSSSAGRMPKAFGKRSRRGAPRPGSATTCGAPRTSCAGCGKGPSVSVPRRSRPARDSGS
jgi:hypothetical protein